MEVNSLVICSLAFLFVGAAMGQDYGRKTRCPPVCLIFCKYGNVLDSNGCPTCECKPAPCPDNSKAVVPERRCNEFSLGPGLLPRHAQCDLGQFCSSTTEVGKCCFEHVAQPAVPCPGNSRAVVPEQRCNGLTLRSPLQPLHRQCRRGTFCSTSSPLREGKCCVQHIEQPHCPVDYSITNCRQKLDSCRDNRDCRPFEKCCPRGCGKRCVPAFGAGYVPGSVRRPPTI